MRWEYAGKIMDGKIISLRTKKLKMILPLMILPKGKKEVDGWKYGS